MCASTCSACPTNAYQDAICFRNIIRNLSNIFPYKQSNAEFTFCFVCYNLIFSHSFYAILCTLRLLTHDHIIPIPNHIDHSRNFSSKNLKSHSISLHNIINIDKHTIKRGKRRMNNNARSRIHTHTHKRTIYVHNNIYT